jgi:5-formyltetrahydrofolate cyclo-ligase
MPEGQVPTKADLRAAALARRDGLSVAARERASVEIADRAFQIVTDFRPGAVGAYRAFGSEVDPIRLVAACHRQGLLVGLPRMIDGAVMKFLDYRRGDPVTRDALGILAPAADAAVLDPEVLIAPVTAFDRRGARLGKGFGVYDRAVDALRRRGLDPLLVGIAFSVQEVPAIPAEAHDIRLDWIVTENETLDFGPAD